MSRKPKHPGFPILVGLMFAAFVFTAPLETLLPAYVEKQLQLPPRFTGILTAVRMLTAAVMFLVGGAVADVFGCRRTLLVGLAASGASGLVFLFADSPLLFAAAAMTGVGFAVGTVGSQGYLLGVTAAGRMGTRTAVLFVGMALGGVLGNLIFGPLADRFGYGTIGGTMAVGMVAVVATGLALLPNVALSATGQRRTLRSSFSGYGDLFARPRFRWLLAVRFFPTCTWGAAIVAYPYLLHVATGTNRQPAFYGATSMTFAACAQIATGRICDRFGLNWPLTIAPIAMLLSCLATALWADSHRALWVFGIALTASAWSLSTTMPALMSTFSTQHERGRIVGAAHVAWALGMACGGLGAGLLLEIGPSACHVVGVVFCALTVVSAWKVKLAAKPPGGG